MLYFCNHLKGWSFATLSRTHVLLNREFSMYMYFHVIWHVSLVSLFPIHISEGFLLVMSIYKGFSLVVNIYYGFSLVMMCYFILLGVTSLRRLTFYLFMTRCFRIQCLGLPFFHAKCKMFERLYLLYILLYHFYIVLPTYRFPTFMG